MNRFLSPLKDASDRIPYIDLLETVAMLFVIAYHLSNYSYKFLEEPGLLPVIQYYLRSCLVCCVPLFLTVNGYLLFRHDLNLKKHLLKTLRYALVTLFWAVITLLDYNRAYGISSGLRQFFTDLLTWRGGVIHLWYMGALVIIYLIFPVLKLVYDNDRRLLLYVAAMVAVFTFGNRLLNYVWTIYQGFRGVRQVWATNYNFFSMFNPVQSIPAYTLVYFCLGAYLPDFLGWLEQFPRKRVNLTASLGLALLCGVHMVFFWLIWRSMVNYYCPIWYGYETLSGGLITLCMAVLLANYRGENPKFAKVLKWISVNTLGVYFIHMAVIYPWKEQLCAIKPLYNLPCNLICAALVLALCTAITALLKKIPLIRYLVS